jgi:hypothetical protein
MVQQMDKMMYERPRKGSMYEQMEWPKLPRDFQPK